MLDYNELVRTAVKYCEADPHDVATVLAMNGLNHRLRTAREVAKEFPEFCPVVDLVERTMGDCQDTALVGEGLIEEYIVIQHFIEEGSAIAQNMCFRALLAGMAGFMERFKPPERNSARIVLRSMENDAAQIMDASAASLVIMGMWFSDYNSFRADVLREVKRLKLGRQG